MHSGKGILLSCSFWWYFDWYHEVNSSFLNADQLFDEMLVCVSLWPVCFFPLWVKWERQIKYLSVFLLGGFSIFSSELCDFFAIYCRKLVEPPYLDTVDWSKWLMFWVDERVVPLDHEDSNYLLASRGFLSKVVSFFIQLYVQLSCCCHTFLCTRVVSTVRNSFRNQLGSLICSSNITVCPCFDRI